MLSQIVILVNLFNIIILVNNMKYSDLVKKDKKEDKISFKSSIYSGLLVIIVVLSAFATNMNDIFNRDMRNLDYFIRDVEDIKIFNSKVDKVFNSNGNVCE